MRIIRTGLALLGSCLLLAGLASTASASSRPAAVRGTHQLVAGFTVQRFAARHGRVYARGVLAGRLAGSSFRHGVSLPVLRPTATANAAQLPPLPNSCAVLHLTLGPINLNLLGLVVRTNRIQLFIDAQRGPGNLLGNLLCGLTGILNPASLARLPAAQQARVYNGLLAMVS